MRKLNSKNKNAKIFALAFVAFLANTACLLFADANGLKNENSSPVAGVNKGDFEILKSQSSARSLEKAVLAYEKFGYVAPLVELAKADAKAKEKLDEIIKILSLNDGLNKCGFLKLAEIYYMQGDFENFAKYASANRVLSSQKLLSSYGSVLDYPELIKIESYQLGEYMSKIIKDLVACEKFAEAIKIFKAVSRLSESNNWYLYETSLLVYSKTSDIALKKEILNILQNTEFNIYAYNKDILVYALTEGDENLKEYFEKAQSAIATIPKERLWRKLADIYGFYILRAGKKSVFYLEKLFESGAELSSDEQYSLANYYLSGDSGYFRGEDIDAENLKANPKLNQIIKLLSESYRPDIGNSTSFFLMRIYKALGDVDNAKFWANKMLESSKMEMSWNLKNEFIKAICKEDYSIFSKEDIEKCINSLSDSEKIDVYTQMAYSFLNSWNGVKKNPKKGREYLKKALNCGAKNLFSEIIDDFDEDEIKEFIKDDEANAEFLLAYANKFTLEKKWNEAFKYYQKAYNAGNPLASVMLFVCYELGKGVEKDAKKAEELFSKIQLEVRENYDSPLSYYKVISHLSHNNLCSFSIKEKVLLAFLKNTNVSERAYLDLLNFYNSDFYADENRTEKIKNLLKNYPNLNLKSYNIISGTKEFYGKDGEFKDLKKVFEFSKYGINAIDYSSDNDCDYIWMLARGIGTEKDEKKAFESINKLSKFSERTSENAMYAYFYENGIGVKKDLEKAKEYRSKVKDFRLASSCFLSKYAHPKSNDLRYYFEKAFEKNSSLSCVSIVDVYEKGKYGFAKNFEKAVAEAEKLSENDYEMLFKIVKMYKATGPSYNPQKYFEYLNKCADRFAEMQEKLPAKLLMEFGYAYMNGRGVLKDEKKAFEYFSEAMRRPFTYNNALSAYEALAYCYEKGLGVEKNLKKAEELRVKIKKMPFENSANDIWSVMKLYDSGAANLCADANRYIEWLKFYANASLTKMNVSELFLVYTRKPQLRDWKKALEYLNLYEKYWPQTKWANYRMGYFNLFGIEMPKDEKKGLEYLKRSAEADYPYAMEKLSYIYEKGIGVEKNAAESAKWIEEFKNLSEQPFIEIASRYIRGSDFTEDKERAKFILKLGADMGNDDCIYYLQNFDVFVESRMAASSVEYWDNKLKK